MKESNHTFPRKEAGGGKRRTALIPLSCTSVLVLSLILLMGACGQATASGPSTSQRIISTSPGVTEILFALGVGDQVVGVTDFCDYPEAAKKIPKIGGLLNANYETMIALKPGLIIHQPDSRKIETFAKQLGIQSLSTSMLSIDQILDSIKSIGAATHSEEAADRLVRRMKEKIDFHRKRLAGIPRKSTLLLLGISADSMQDIYGVGPNAYLGELLELSGGENILAASRAQYPKVSKEFIIHESPEVIIEAGPARILTEKASIKRKRGWERFPTIRAVKTGSIHFIAADYVLIPGPRLVNIIDDFVKAVHPEAFASHSTDGVNAGGPPR